MDIREILQEAIRTEASDIFIVPGVQMTFKINGRQHRREDFGRMLPEDTARVIREIYQTAQRNPQRIAEEDSDDDFSFSLPGVGRFRVNVYHQRSSLAAVVRVIRFGIPDYRQMLIPEEVMAVRRFHHGVVLVTGQTGSGKSTTLACILDAINHERSGHILTLEDPIEYVHRHERCIVSQREIYSDATSYLAALRSALRESPDVILLGEMRDHETIDVAMKAAETGHLLLSSLHTTGAANTVDRIIDMYPANQQQQVRMQLSMTLQAVVSQQLVPDIEGKLLPVFEIMLVNPAIRNLIRESKTHQIDAAIQAGSAEGMRTMDASLLQLYTQKKITKETVLTYCLNYEATSRRLKVM